MKKILKILGIIILIIIIILVVMLVKNYITSQRPYMEDDYYKDFNSSSDLEQKYFGIGSYEVSKEVIKSEDDVIKNYRVFYPKELEVKNEKYPLIVVTNASNTAALNYEAFFKRLASWGFIVIGNDDRQAGTGESTATTLDYILALNNDSTSKYYKKIDEENIGSIGYSQGGAGAINAVTDFDNSNKYKVIYTGSAAYSYLSISMGWEYDISKVQIPYFMTAGTGNSDDRGIEDINKEFAGVAPLKSLIENYDAITDDVFKIRARVTGAEHEEMQMLTDGYMTAWMLYNLKDDEEAGTVFIGENAEILNNTNWQDVEKNR